MVREGYKQTEVGVIPEDWDVCCLDLVAKLSSGTTPSRSQEDRYYRNGKYHWVKTTDLNNSRITATEEKVTQEALDETCLQVYPPGTVFVAMYGGFNQIGRTGLLEISAAVNQALIAIQPKANKLNSAYLLATLNYRVEHWKSVASSSRKDPNITSQDVKYFTLPLPEIEEQSAIAATLSDVDALIASLDKLIAKQRHLKTATMQQLLTGKKRLPGFGGGKGYKQTEVGVIPEDWELYSLGEITEYIKGFAFKASDFQTHGVRVIRVSDTTFDLIKDDNEIFIDEKKAPFFRKWSMREGDLIISTVGSKPPMYDSMVGKATFVDVKNRNSLLNQNAVIIRSKNWSREAQIFLHNHLKQPRYIDHIEKIFRGNANQASITLKDLFEFLIPMPKDSEEQRAIATVLSDMDAAISALETRRAKTQAIKQGMMQELLTGRTRLV